MMAWLRARRARKAFHTVGKRCVIASHGLDVKGRIDLGDECEIRGNVVLRTHFDGGIHIGNRVVIADHAMISANESVEIGDDTFIGPYTVLRDNNHLFQGTQEHWRVTPLLTQPIKVGANCYIAMGVYVMPGVTIADGAVIAPRSIVTKNVGSLEIWAGSPALRVAHRLDPSLQSSLKRHQELIALFGSGVPLAPASAPEDVGDPD